MQDFLNYKAKHEYLVCVDSDGCVFDTMEIKHKECFCPATIKVWGLQAISKYVREAWEFGNLYSIYRGQSRFIELVKVFEWLKEREEIKQYNFQFPDISSFAALVKSGKTVNNTVLKDLGATDPVIKRAYEWSMECNRLIADMVYNIPPFPYAKESLEAVSQLADVVVVSATATEALEREWAEHDLMQYVHFLCGQEIGTKSECIAALSKHYAKDKVLMIGDALGDKKAALDNGAKFYPICPNKEVKSWQHFLKESKAKFLEGTYQEDYYEPIFEAFQQVLPTALPWQNK